MAASLGWLEKALEVMEQPGSMPSVQVYDKLLKVCLQNKSLAGAKRVHAHLVKSGLESDMCLAESVVEAMVRCGSLADGLQLFEKLSRRTGYTWTVIISGYCKAGRWMEALKGYQRMQQEGVEANKYTFTSLLRACGGLADPEEAKRIHADMVRQGCEVDLFVGAALVDMYVKCGSLSDARHVFDRLPERNVVSWTAMLAGYAQQNQGDEAIVLYERMQQAGITPDHRTFVIVLQACGSIAEKEESILVDGEVIEVDGLQKLKTLHAEAARKGHESNVFVGTTLVSVYTKCGSVRDAEYVFERSSQRNVVSWNAMVAGYAQQGRAEKAIELYGRMRREGVSPDVHTFASVLQACGLLAEKEESSLVDGQAIKVRSLRMGEGIHAEACLKGFNSDLFLCNSVVSMYAKTGSIRTAEDVFFRLPERDLVSWNAMLAGYAQHEEGEKALRLYALMRAQGVKPDEITFLCMLEACSNIGALSNCYQIHRHVVSSGLDRSCLVGTALIHAYSKCGSMLDARYVFDSLPEKSLRAWSALIAGYARQGHYTMSVELFEDMCLTGVEPSGVTFLSLLSACSHAGMVDKGLAYFEAMTRDYGISPSVEHYGTLADLFGRAGLLSLAEGLLLKMPVDPNLTMWLSLLGACRKHGNVTLGRRAFDRAVYLQPKHCAAYVLMSNTYSQAGMWMSAREIDDLRLRTGAWKEPGQSWIEHDMKVHTFVAGDQRHPQSKALYGLLTKLQRELEERTAMSRPTQQLP